MIPINETHDPALKSWIESANQHSADFPIQNLPYGVFRTAAGGPRIGVAIGDRILDLASCQDAGLFHQLPRQLQDACRAASLNELMSLGTETQARVRNRLSRLLRADNDEIRGRDDLLVPMRGATMLLPAHIGDYSDFYASIHHATNVGSMFRPDNPLLPNYKYVPIGYHGRSSSLVRSGTAVHRPSGQLRADPSQPPVYAPSRMLDYELEVGLFIGPGNAQGSPIPIADAEQHMFGVCLVNDWSARDIQSWEYQPLGPFLAKSFATTISPWVVTLEALAPFRTGAFARPNGDPEPLEYLNSSEDREHGGIALRLEVFLQTEAMRRAGIEPVRLSAGRFEQMYWTFAQMVAHHTSNGCNLQPGDLLASGTVSGPSEDERGCLLELTWRGSNPLRLPGGEERRFLADGDEVIFRGYCERQGFTRIGLGECRGVIVPTH